MSHELAYPVYCRKCREQIQSDALFCPKCGWDQRNTQVQEPEPPVVAVAQEPLPLQPPPQTGYAVPPQIQATPPPQQVVYVQQNNNVSGGAWAALGLFALLVPPMGCVTIPAILFAVWAVAVAGLMAAPSIVFSVVGVIGKAIAVKMLPESKKKAGDWILVTFIVIGLIINVLLLRTTPKS